MKDLFYGFYPPTKQELDGLWTTGIFSFDSSVLLNLYRYSEPTRSAFFDSLKWLGGRLWITHQVALEYHRGRINAIRRELDAYSVGKLQEIHDKFVSPYQHPLLKQETADAFRSLFKTITDELRLGRKQHEELLTDDALLQQLTVLFDGKIGTPYPPDKRAELEKEGKDRFARKIPPGYSDKGKTAGDEYGDLFIWKQLLDKAKESKTGIVFVADDNKPDWWFDLQLELPHPPLREEMKTVADVPFYMYTGRTFLEIAGERRGQPIKAEVIEEMRETERITRLRESVLNLDAQLGELQPFVGKWRMEATSESPEFVLTIHLHSVHKSHVPDATGKWKVAQGHAIIEWSDGWLDVLKPQGARGIFKIAFAPGVDRTGPPTNSQWGNKED